MARPTRHCFATGNLRSPCAVSWWSTWSPWVSVWSLCAVLAWEESVWSPWAPAFLALSLWPPPPHAARIVPAEKMTGIPNAPARRSSRREKSRSRAPRSSSGDRSSGPSGSMSYLLGDLVDNGGERDSLLRVLVQELQSGLPGERGQPAGAGEPVAVGVDEQLVASGPEPFTQGGGALGPDLEGASWHPVGKW